MGGAVPRWACTACGIPLAGAGGSCPGCGAAQPMSAARPTPIGRRVVVAEMSAVPRGHAARPVSPAHGQHPAGRAPAGRTPVRAVHRGPAGSGTVTGPVDVGVVAAAHRGQKALGAAAWALLALCPPALVLAAGPASALAVVRSAAVPLLMLIATLMVHQGALLLVRPRPSGIPPVRPPVTTEVRRFRLTGPTGTTTDCVLTGELVGGAVHRGDVVDVFGRRDRSGHVHVADVHVPASGHRVRGRRSVVFLLARSSALVPAVVAAVCAVAVVCAAATS